MKIEEDDLLIAYHGGNLWRFHKARKHEFSWFGGPIEEYPEGIEHGPQALHQVGTLWGHHLPCLLDAHITQLPLFYGFCFDGCRLRYRVSGEPAIELLDLEPAESTEDFPYLNYPAMLPYYPLAPTEPEQVAREDFLEMLHQPIDLREPELIVVLPCPFTIGVSLWGREGDAEEVQVVFRVDPAAKTVEGFNLCG